MKEEVTLLLPCMYAYHTKAAAAAAAPPSSLGRQTDRTGRGGRGQLHSPPPPPHEFISTPALLRLLLLFLLLFRSPMPKKRQ